MGSGGLIMPRYTVIITRDVTESCVVEVQAKSKIFAADKAFKWLAQSDDPKWTVDDGSGDNSDPYITDCSEA
jgi:hypothetical protein